MKRPIQLAFSLLPPGRAAAPSADVSGDPTVTAWDVAARLHEQALRRTL